MDDNEYGREIAAAKADLNKLWERFRDLFPDWDELATATKEDGQRLLTALGMLRTIGELDEAIKESSAEYQQMKPK